jgi:hypothetical protein
MIRISIDRSSMAATRRLIREYERKVGREAGDSVIAIAREASRQAAQKCPPFGLTQKTGDKFQKSIAKQVARAVRNAEVTGQQGAAAAIHASKRDSKGRVPKGLKTDGNLRRAPVAVRDRESHIDKKQANAGMVKGAWIHAGHLLGRVTSPIAGRRRAIVGRWILRHMSNGKAEINRRGINTVVTLTNTIRWASKVQTQSMLKSAVNAAFKGVEKEMQRVLDAIRP